jgi:hypothetical protein
LAIRALPLADVEYFSGGESDPSGYARKAWLIWQAERLLKDFAPRHARTVLELAERVSIPRSELDQAISRRRIEAEGLAKIAPVLETPPQGIKLDDKDELPASLSLKGGGELPEGEASIFVSRGPEDPPKPVELLSKPGKIDLRTGLLVVVGPEHPSSPIELAVSRTEPTLKPLKFPLRPGVFYRGQIFPKGRTELTLSMAPKGRIEVALKQSDRVLIRLHGDQFDRHRNQGFLHPGSRLACKMKISHDFTRRTVVRVMHGFPDPNLEMKVRDVSLEPGKDNTEVEFVVEPVRDQIPDDRTREYIVEIYPEKETKAKERQAPLYKNQFPFRVLRPDEIVAIDFAGYVAEEGRVYVVARHLAIDPVCGTVDVAATIGGNTPGTQRRMKRGQTQYWWNTYPGEPPPKIPLIVRINNRPKATITQDILTGPDAPAAGPGGAAPGGAGGEQKPPNL